ncbi:hypothetical protein TSUD_187630 [Trifolium subterraneum]|uniref:Uncharacterized protein n=1 Tax=Trifolium subterraneum TaxID=3900 RepID=A0A2Z6P598_TRISU|nr:hypothetical protein TSUD_187630 [Trifolium subterraneum]
MRNASSQLEFAFHGRCIEIYCQRPTPPPPYHLHQFMILKLGFPIAVNLNVTAAVSD